MGNFYVVSAVYLPTGAATNRCLAFLRGFDEQNIKTKSVFLMPDAKRSKVDDSKFNNMDFIYLCDRFGTTNKYFKYLFGCINAIRLRRMLKPGDKVFLTGAIYTSLFTSKSGVEVYHERTEHPDAVHNYTSFLDFNNYRYLKTCRKMSGIFVISTALKYYFINYGVSPKKVHVINMIVDMNRFKDITKQENVEKYIAYCGTASNNKDGVDQLLTAFSIVAKSHPDVKLYIIGNAPTRAEGFSNIELVEKLGIKDRVVFTGLVKSEEMPQLLKNAQVLALDRPDSLQARNGFPTKLGEYLMTANPVVVTKVGDIPLFLKDGETALLADERNPEDFASKLSWALDNPKEAGEIGVKGQKVAISSFNYLLESKKIIEIIED